MKTDDFKIRYIVKLGSSVLIAVFNMIIQLILPRALSLDDYGYYTYNLNVFTSIVVMANLSTSNALVSKFSKNNEEIGWVYSYLKFYSIVSILLCISVLGLYPTSFVRETFAGQNLLVIVLGLMTSIIMKLLTDCISIYDAFAVSRFPALMQILIKAGISSFVVIAFISGNLNLVLFYLIQGIIMSVVLCIMLYAIVKEQTRRYPEKIVRPAKEYIYHYAKYCSPLIFATIFSQFVVIITNWALMRWSGTKEQAMFGASWQLNTLVSYTFSPYAELSKREFAILHNDVDALKHRFIQSLKIIVWLTSYFAVFIGIGAEWILPIIYGENYSGANTVTLFIMYYTVLQAWGQICGSYMLAVEKTRMNALLSCVWQVVSLTFVFLFQIPNPIFKNGLGSLGIALNYFATCFICANLNAFCVANGLRISKIKLLGIQLTPIALCSVLVFGLKNIFNVVLPEIGLLKIFVSGIIYTAIIVCVILARPELIGMSHQTLKKYVKRRK